MAANQKSQDIDTLSVRKIYAKGDNNSTLPANSILLTDGMGGTKWIDEQTFQRGVNFNTFETSQSTFRSGPGSTKFSILDGINAGLKPSASGNSATLYAKAFGQINVQGQDSVYSFDTYTGNINSNVNIVGSGIINVTTNTNQNKIDFYSPDNGLSSLSTVVENISSLNGSLGNIIASFNSPFSTFIYDTISSYSTVQGPLVTFPKLYSTISSFSTSMGQVVRYNELQSSLSSYSTSQGPLVNFPQMYSTISSFSTSIAQILRFNDIQSTISSYSTSQQHVVTFPEMYSTISSFSTSLGPVIRIASVFSSISSFSTSLGPVIRMSQILSTMSSISTARIVDINNSISSYSTVQGPLVSLLNFSSVLSTQNFIMRLNTNTINTSTLQQQGYRQPFIQYGSDTLSSTGSIVIILPIRYLTIEYIIQLTYVDNDSGIAYSLPLKSQNIQVDRFTVYGNNNGRIHWTTYGNLF